jgi:hypothetical protein
MERIVKVTSSSASVFRYVAPVVAVAVAMFLRWPLEVWFGGRLAFITFYPAIALVAIAAGGGPGVFATVLSAAAVAIWLPLDLSAAGQAAAIALFTATGLIMSVMAELLHRARQRQTGTLEEQVVNRNRAPGTRQRQAAEGDGRSPAGRRAVPVGR